MPFSSRARAATGAERCALAPAPSVTLTAVARLAISLARATKPATSVETGGVNSVVMVKVPAASARARALVACGAAVLSIMRGKPAGGGTLTAEL